MGLAGCLLAMFWSKEEARSQYMNLVYVLVSGLLYDILWALIIALVIWK